MYIRRRFATVIALASVLGIHSVIASELDHPTPDHYLPLPSVLGTSYEDEIGQVLHRAIDLEILALDAYGFGMAAA